MERAAFEHALAALGLDQTTARALMLLPLVQVAWADGGVQHAERTLIKDLARTGLGLEAGALGVVEGWLQVRPSDDVVRRGRDLLVSLALRPGGGLVDLPPDALTALPVLCARVAEAAGGFFGLAWAVDPREEQVLQELSAAVARGRARLEWLLPLPEGGLSDLPEL
jgi:hypothetical protein